MTGAPTLVLLGGGFSDDPDTLLDDFVLETAGRPRPKVCFLPTASGDAPGYIEGFHAAFGARGAPLRAPLREEAVRPGRTAHNNGREVHLPATLNL
ncbi:hypothetical protein CP981_09150 [Streptomyces platensis]|uniref:Peptidase family S51 n=1 Tax=Streptomyces platensis TaxID=58346 RepID=A0AAE6NF59_STRPT|nr:hypothetical protein BG653_05687 [Streptomyces platensis]QEV51804.1 hypothetical protein CP981_09150 [Streptomyces platensis]